MAIELQIRLPQISKWQQNERAWYEAHAFCSAHPFTDEELLAALKEWRIPEAGKRYILTSRSTWPSRKVSGRARNVCSKYTSRKMKRRVETESTRVEFPAVVRYDFDGVTREFYCQPAQVMIPTVIRRTSRRGKVTEYTQPIPYTPDVLRLTREGPFVEEWKTEQGLRELARKYPHRYYLSDSDATWHCPERESFFKELGMTYCLRSSRDHDGRFRSNVDELRAYLVEEAEPLREDAFAAIFNIVERHGAISLAVLAKSAYEDDTPWGEAALPPTPSGQFRLDDVYKAIADQRLWVDLEYDDLTEQHLVIVCASKDQLEAVRWRRPPVHSVTTAFTMTVDIGTEFLFVGDASVYTVTAPPLERVFYKDSNSERCGDLDIADFMRLMEGGKIAILSTEKTTAELLAESEYISDERIAEARRRFELVRAHEAGAVVAGRSLRTLQRYKKTKREAGDSRPMQMFALIPKQSGGPHAQISYATLALIKEVTLGHNNPTNPLPSFSYETFLRLCAERNVERCSRPTYYRHSAEMRDLLKREGSRRAYSVEPAVWYLYRTDKIHGGRPFHRVHIDHTLLDVIIKVRGYGGRTYRLRPWLTVIIDSETRMVLSFYLAAHAPSTVSCMMAVRAMVATHKRMPDYIVCDNDKAFHSDAFDNLCDLCDTTIDYRPAHESRFGTVIERLFGTANKRFIHNLVGTTKATQHVRTLTRSVDPIRADHLNFAELHGLLDYFFFVEYNRESRHPAHDHTPEEYMHIRLRETGRRLTRVRPFDQRFMLQTLVPAKRDNKRLIDRQMGVKVGNIWYWSDEFTQYRHRKTKVKVMLDMWDISIAYVVLGKRWVKCESSLLMRYRQLTHIELRYALYEVRLRLRRAPEDTFESVLNDVLAEHNVPAVADATAATRSIYEAAGLASINHRTFDIERRRSNQSEATSGDGLSPAGDEVTPPSTTATTTPDASLPPESAGTQAAPPTPKRRFKLDFASLPVSKPVTYNTEVPK
ncbi:Mu transposase C-terminal domain-containing protein [Paraburkholderia guartelaensis]|uniref:Mu transposase C-terminal domain-containing protein n=1 Tax=Paraburkholderia guartelaensis TaxID=2546446 RepID=A0ABU9SD44_9BURK